jgi:hypothetical protein
MSAAAMVPSTPPAGLQEPTKKFLSYLQKHPELRARIKAPFGQTVAYAGAFPDGASWERLLRRQLSDPRSNDFLMLPDVLRAIPCPPDLYKHVGLVTPPSVRSFLDYVNFLTGESGNKAQVPWNPDGFIIWRALSGILISQAQGRVRLMIGDTPKPEGKVFFKTEIFVLDRNPNIDTFSQQAVQALRAQLKSGAVKGTIELM